ncbi:MAG: response regulator, partial [Nitrospirota bacterium]|nr:response regulator [Nitrospirota bacterium]
TSLLEEAIDINRGYAERYEVSLELQGERPELLVNGCRDRLMQVLTNLLSNAVKYAPVGGTVFASACCQNDVVRVSVVDHGPGIPEEFSEDLFAKFTRVDGSDARQKCGTGLGLSISKAIVEQHGGTIGYDTEDGRGTRFFFDLPERRQEIDVASQEADAIVDEQSDPPRILVCAEDQDIATLLGMMLERSGYAFDIAQDARQAKASLRRSVYAAMTLDLVLPDQDGISLIRELRQRPETADLPIIVVSANTERGTGELSGDAFSIVGWLDKPIDQDALERALNSAVTKFHGKKPRILHVEDDADILHLTSALLGDAANVTAVTTQQTARRLLKEQNFDLVILDLMLPDGPGEELLPSLHKADGSAIPVIVFSAK